MSALSRSARASSKEFLGEGTDDDDDADDDTEEDDDVDDSVTDPAERERVRLQRLRSRVEEFYRAHNPEKLGSIDAFMDWIAYHGFAAFNRKLREKYGTDVEMSARARTGRAPKKEGNLRTKAEKEKRRKEREALAARYARSKSIMNADVDLARLESAAADDLLGLSLGGPSNNGGGGTAPHTSRTSRAGSTNPFDALTSSLPSTAFASSASATSGIAVPSRPPPTANAPTSSSAPTAKANAAVATAQNPFDLLG